MQYDFSKHPGRWRPGAAWVSSSDGDVVYEAPDRELVEPLVDEALAQITDSEAPTPVTAAMAHLNLTLIHPFSDGNGRMARGWRLRRSLYVTTTKATAGEDISDAVATNDLAAMTRAGLLHPVGEKRGRYYAPTEELTNPWQRIRSRRPIRRDSSASWRRISCAKSGSAPARSCDQVIVRSRRRGPHR